MAAELLQPVVASVEGQAREVKPTIRATHLGDIMFPLVRRIYKAPIVNDAVEIDDRGRYVAGRSLRKGDTVTLVPIDGVNIAGTIFFADGEATPERVERSTRVAVSHGEVSEFVALGGDEIDETDTTLVGHLLPCGGRRLDPYVGVETITFVKMRELIEGYYTTVAKCCNCAYVRRNGVVTVVAIRAIPKGQRLCVARGAIPTIFQGKSRDAETIVLLMVQSLDDAFITKLMGIRGVPPFLECE